VQAFADVEHLELSQESVLARRPAATLQAQRHSSPRHQDTAMMQNAIACTQHLSLPRWQHVREVYNC
jgi:hypothetical protein